MNACGACLGDSNKPNLVLVKEHCFLIKKLKPFFYVALDKTKA